MAPLGQEVKNLQTELKEHRINALEGNQKPIDPNQKGRKNATRIFGYFRTNGHIPYYCRKKMRDEEVKQLQNEVTAEKKVTFTQDYNKRRGYSQGSGNWTSRNNDNRTTMPTPDSSNNNDRYNDYKARSPYQPNQDQSRTWGGNDNYSRSPSTTRQDSAFTDFRRQPRSISLNPSVVNRFGN